MTEREWNRCFKKHQRKAVLYEALSIIALFGIFVVPIITTACFGISTATIIVGLVEAVALLLGGCELSNKAETEFNQGRYNLRHRYYTPMDEEKEMGLY